VPIIGVILAPGMMEDFLLFLFNNHVVLSCMAVTKAASFNRTNRRLALVLHNSFAFFLTTFNVSLEYFGIPVVLIAFVNLLGVAPLCLLLNAMTVTLLRSKGFRYDDKRSIFYKFREGVGVVLVLSALLCIGG
jgi:hypothetical protein